MPSPHNAERYVALFRRAYKSKRAVRLRGDFAGMLGSLRVEDIDGHDIVTGEFYKFFDLKLDGQWFNTLEQKAAEDTELAEIHIPDHLKPHFQIFPFVFFPAKHRLFFIAKDQYENFSPGQAQKLLSVIFEEYSFVREFGEIEIIVEPNADTLQRIFSMPRLKSLHIEVIPPNPDDLEEAERKLFEKMHRLGANKQTVELTSKESSGLSPDQELKTLAEIAQSNGKVDGRGEDEAGQTIYVSTADHPMLTKVAYDPSTQLRSETLILESRDLLRKIARRVN